MGKKTIAGLLAVVVIVIAVMVSGCAEKPLGSLGGAPAINNPEDVVKAYFYYVNNGDAERAMNLLVERRITSELTPYSGEEIKEEAEGYRESTELFDYVDTYTFENLKITDVTRVPQFGYYLIGYNFTQKSVSKKDRSSKDKECWSIVVETEEGFRIVTDLLHYPNCAFHEGETPAKDL